jgi:type I restriction enzyme, S subunit
MSRVQVSDILHVQNGFAFESELFSKRRVGLPVARIRDVVRGYSGTFYTGNYAKEYEIGNGDLLIGMDGEFNVGVWQGGRALLNQRVCKIVPKDGTADKFYLKHRLALLVKQMEAATPYVTVKHLSSEELKAEEIELPALPEQKRIAALLEKADRLRRTRRYARQLSDTFLQSVFLKMFGDLASNAKGWETSSFGDLIVRGPQNGIYKPASAYGSGTPILRIDAFYNGVVTDISKLKRMRITSREIDLYGLEENDIVINRVNSRSHLGKSALIPALREPTVFESNIMRLRTDGDRVHRIYMLQFLQTPFLNRQIQRAGKDAVNQASINQQDVDSFQVRVPPLPLQQKFADIVRRFERLRAQQREAERQAEHLFQTLLHRAFSEGGL